ncbi:MAG: M23 family metallopeptidase [Caulobacter sp.]|nr:M23 family metallopeptidase [Caulobacter sp.]
MRIAAVAAILLSLIVAGAAGAASPPLQVRTFPGDLLYPYPLDSIRGVQGLLVPNTAMINGGPMPVTIATVDFVLLRGDEVIETRTLRAGDLERSAKAGAGLQASGMMEAVGFMFGDILGKPAAKLPASATLGNGEALLVANQVFAWSGQRDALRITARSADGQVLGQVTVALSVGEPEARYIFPIAGRSYVQAGPSLHTHHRWAPPEAYAYDIVRLGDGGLTYTGDGMKFTDYAGYGVTVRAAAEGEVVAVVDGQIEDPAQFRRPGETTEAYFGRIQAWQAEGMAKGPDFLAGNYIVIRHAWGEYSVYAHLKPGSPTVKIGQSVKAGDPIGQVGSSGSSTEPHLHFHVCDAPSALACAGRPASFKGVEVPWALLPGAIQSGDILVAE